MGQLGNDPLSGGGGGGSGGRDWWNNTPSGLNRTALNQIAELLKQYPGAQQISDFEWVTPEGRVLTLRRDEAGNAIFQEGGADESARRLKALGAATGGGGGSVSRMAGDDPRYWALEYAKLDQDERLTLAKIEADLKNAGMDANSARQQALAGLIANKNTQAVGLAGESINAAKIAADYAANPRDAVAELHFRNAVGGPAPFSAMSGHPTESAQYKTALDAKFQKEFLAAMRDNPQKAQDFRKYVTANRMTTAEDGININVPEMAAVIGLETGRVYSTLAEPREDGTPRPEQLRVIPLPSEKEKDKELAERKKAGKDMLKATANATRMAGGGTITGIPQPSDFIAELRKALSMLGGTGGGVGPTTTALPSPRLLAGAPARMLEEDPDLAAYTQAGYSSMGISPDTLAAQIARFTPRSAQRAGQTGIRVSF
jgi:hypothetical protein